jgi:hypothetical protein
MMVPMTDNTFPIRIFCLLPSVIPKAVMIIQLSHEANRKTDAIKEIVFVFGYYTAVRFFEQRISLRTPVANSNESMKRIPLKNTAIPAKCQHNAAGEGQCIPWNEKSSRAQLHMGPEDC